MKALLRRLLPAEAAAVPDVASPIADPPRSSSRTHVGHVRRINEDRVLENAELGLWAVADGMGGQSCGDVAAETVIRSLAQSQPRSKAAGWWTR